MVEGAVIQQTTKRLGGGMLKGLGFVKIFGFIAIFIFFILPVIQAVLITIEADDITPGIQYLAPILFQPTLKLHETSIQIIEQGGFRAEGATIVLGSWDAVKVGWNVFQPVWMMWKWIWIFMLIGLLIIGNTSQKPAAYIFAVIIFIVLIQPIAMMLLGVEGLENTEAFILPFQTVFIELPQAFLVIVSNYTPDPEEVSRIFNETKDATLNSSLGST